MGGEEVGDEGGIVEKRDERLKMVEEKKVGLFRNFKTGRRRYLTQRERRSAGVRGAQGWGVAAAEGGDSCGREPSS